MRLRCLLFLSIAVFLCINVVRGQELEFSEAAWNSNGDLVAYSSSNQIFIRDDLLQDVVTLTPPSPPTQPNTRIQKFKWSPDGTMLAAIIFGEQSSLLIWETSSWDIINEFPSASFDIAFSPDGRYMATIDGLQIKAYDLMTDVLVTEIQVENTDALEWSPTNNNRLVARNNFADGNIHVIDPMLGQIVAQLDYDASVHPSFSPDGQYLALSRQINTHTVIDILETNNFSLVNTTSLAFGLFLETDSVFWVTNNILVTSSLEGEAIKWHLSENTTQITQPILISDIATTPLYWHPNGLHYIQYIINSQINGIYSFDSFTGEVVARKLETSQSYIQSILLADDAQNRTPLSNGATVNLAETVDTTLTALTEPDEIGSVLFDLSGSVTITQVDNTAPYELDWTPTSGTYTLTVTPYTEANGTGTTGIPMTLEFTIAASG